MIFTMALFFINQGFRAGLNLLNLHIILCGPHVTRDNRMIDRRLPEFGSCNRYSDRLIKPSMSCG